MNASDVERGDMDPVLTEDELNQVFSGAIDPAHADDQLVVFLVDGAASLRSFEPGRPSPALHEFLGVTSPPTRLPAGFAATEDLDLRRSGSARRKSKMFTSSAAFAATMTGKILLGAAVAAAAMGGAHATGVVDLDPADDRIAEIASEAAPAVDTTGATAPDIDDIDAGASALVSADHDASLTIPVDDVGSFVMSLVGDELVLDAVEVNSGWSAALQTDGSVLFSSATGQVSVTATFDGASIRIASSQNGSTTTNLFDTVGQLLPADGRGSVGVQATIAASFAINVDGAEAADSATTAAGEVVDDLSDALDAGLDAAGGVLAETAGDATSSADTEIDAGGSVDAAGIDAAGDVTGSVGATVDAGADAARDAVDDVTGSVGATVDAGADAARDAVDDVTGSVGATVDAGAGAASNAGAGAGAVDDVTGSVGAAVDSGLGAAGGVNGLGLDGEAETSTGAQGSVDLGGAVGGLGSLFGS